ncbi:amidohydrolase family protein [Streptomyces olivaceus]|uniref:amidohydrolase family protein n=1 Tax=Streptomyces olivaceus TaxID=47716 RepID=UPI001CCF131D|nr:amidohydrolase family protein [Streptomyces olivaceus]MBZ6226333.1 amidohydrolase family protein [Streptomyces olivaceus]
MAEYAPFDPDTREPRESAPALACDSQTHIFGAAGRFPTRPDAAYVVYDATVEAMLAMHKQLGIERGVIVQSTAYGTDHGALLEALRIAGPAYQGCGVVNDSVGDDQLARMHEAGVRGARFNFHPKLKNALPTADEVRRTARRVVPLGWHLKLHMNGIDPREVTPLLEDLDTDVVIDHMGPLQYGLGVEDPHFRHVQDLLRRGNWWVMLSNGDRRSVAGRPWDDATAYARQYIEAAPERVLWATDWPHPLHAGPVPNDGELMDLLARYAPDPAVREQILVTNPQKLFRFEDGRGGEHA